MASAFMWDDKVRAAALGSISGDDAVGSLPLTNLQDPQPRIRTRWRQEDISNPIGIIADFGASTTIQCVALICTSLSAATTIRWYVGDDPTFATYDFFSGAISWTPAAADNGNFIGIDTTGGSGRYLLVEISLNIAQTEADIGLLRAGPIWVPGRAYSYGISEGRVMLDRRDVNPLTGAHFPVTAPFNPRRATFGLDLLSGAEAIGQHRQLLDTLGAAGDLLWIPDTGLSLAERNRRSIWGPVNAPGEMAGLTHRAPGAFNRSFSITERL